MGYRIFRRYKPLPMSPERTSIGGLPAEGFEPPTYGLQNRCTTTVLSRHGSGDIITASAAEELPKSIANPAGPGYVAARAANFSPNRSTAAWYSLARSRKRSLARVM